MLIVVALILLLTQTPTRGGDHAAFICSATGRRRSASCSSSTGCRPLMMMLTGRARVRGARFLAGAVAPAPGRHFHALLQFLLMGLNGAFLTGDLFNLFVFFEVLLAASYGLALHGSGRLRVKAGLHYIAVNLAASSAVPDRCQL